MLHLFTKVPSKLSTIVVAFDAGGRAEGEKFSPGLAHMLEHMIFKGTEKRTCLDITREIAFLGGNTNAFTSNEMVSFYITVPFENVEPAMDILSDIVFNSTLPEEEFLKEREVVLEEEASSNDDVGSVMWDALCSNFFTGQFASPLIGTPDSIKGFSRRELARFYKKFYKKSNAIVSLCGNHSKRDAKRLLNKYFGRSTGKMSHPVVLSEEQYRDAQRVEIYRPALEHTYVLMCYPGLPTNLDAKTEAGCGLMNSILGQGMDSRLFTEVRERNGLAYSVGSSSMSFRDRGVFMIDASTRDDNVEKMIGIIESETNKMKENLVSDEELQRAKNKFRSGIYGLTERASSLAQFNLRRKFLEQPDLDEVSAAVEAATSEDVLEAARVLLDDSKRMILTCASEEE